MIETTITCDNCHREKDNGNGWWILNGNEAHIMLYLMPFSAANKGELHQGMHACSRECAHKITEQWMASHK